MDARRLDYGACGPESYDLPQLVVISSVEHDCSREDWNDVLAVLAFWLLILGFLLGFVARGWLR